MDLWEAAVLLATDFDCTFNRRHRQGLGHGVDVSATVIGVGPDIQGRFLQAIPGHQKIKAGNLAGGRPPWAAVFRRSVYLMLLVLRTHLKAFSSTPSDLGDCLLAADDVKRALQFTKLKPLVQLEILVLHGRRPQLANRRREILVIRHHRDREALLDVHEVYPCKDSCVASNTPVARPGVADFPVGFPRGNPEVLIPGSRPPSCGDHGVAAHLVRIGGCKDIALGTSAAGGEKVVEGFRESECGVNRAGFQDVALDVEHGFGLRDAVHRRHELKDHDRRRQCRAVVFRVRARRQLVWNEVSVYA
mmetsp:Transcript_13554/g.29791  ORF Transcript_13554/g.29791 Transcript_13554/m.29791 type:complete len:304 (+) Transcript_13554:1040-1951(+)